jgi:acid phosphatase family membrane protein YuiD
MDRQVYALFAPMSIFANAVLVDGVGMPLSEGNTALELNKLVRKLPWQDAVAHQVATTAKRSRPRAPSALMAA